jgi:hypothetical protein
MTRFGAQRLRKKGRKAGKKGMCLIMFNLEPKYFAGF